MTISRGQMERQLRMGGGIMDIVPREPAIFGGIKKAVKKAGKAVKKIAKSDVGKAALIGAAEFGIPGTQLGGIFGRASFGGAAPGIFGFGGIGNALAAGKAKFFPDAMTKAFGKDAMMGDPAQFFSSAVAKGAGEGIKMGTVGKLATLGAVSAFLTSELGMTPEQAEEELARDPSPYLERYYRNLNPPTADTNSEQYEKQVRDFVAANTSEYAVGGRVGFANGEEVIGDEVIEQRGLPTLKTMPEFKGDEVKPAGIMMAEGPVLPPDPTQPVNPFGPKPGDFGIEEDIPIKMASDDTNERVLEALFEKYLEMGLSPKDAAEKAREEFERMGMRGIEETRKIAAIGGKMDTASENAMQAAGIEGLPIRQNPKGVKELDLRDSGGFIPPVGIKEKEDDIPAMLSNNEFVFTADAVRGMGEGDVDLGAQRMYDMMKKLEAGGRV